MWNFRIPDLCSARQGSMPQTTLTYCAARNYNSDRLTFDVVFADTDTTACVI
jgi:hypothetical protein